MTKLEICAIEDANPGQVFLYPEGSFYKAYQKSAWLLCSRVHPFKVSARPLKGLDGSAHFYLKKVAPGQEKHGGIADFASMSAQRFITQKHHCMHLQ